MCVVTAETSVRSPLKKTFLLLENIIPRIKVSPTSFFVNIEYKINGDVASPGTFLCSPARSINPSTLSHCQCFFFSGNIGHVTPNFSYFHYLKIHFWDVNIQKTCFFHFEKKALVTLQTFRLCILQRVILFSNSTQLLPGYFVPTKMIVHN